MTRRTKLIVGAVALVALIPLWIAVLHYRAKARLDAYKQELVSKGERLTVAELTPVRAESNSNGAAEFIMAADKARRLALLTPRPMFNFPTGHARVAWRQSEIFASGEEYNPSTGGTNVWPVLRSEVQSNYLALEALRHALNQPVLDVDYQSDYVVGYAPQELGAVVLMHLHEGNKEKALEYLRTSLVLPWLWKIEPYITSQRRRVFCVQYNFELCWEALQFKGWTEEDLESMQRDWEKVDLLSGTANCFEMERAGCIEESEKIRNDSSRAPWIRDLGADPETSDAADLNRGYEALRRVIYRYLLFWLWKEVWFYDEEGELLKKWQDELALVRSGKERFGAEIKNHDDVLLMCAEALASNNPKRRLEALAPKLNPLLFRQRLGQTLAEMTTTVLALERYHLLNSRYPAALNELQPRFLPKTPLDFMDGKPLRYRLNEDGTFVLYSVGENGVDDGGDPRAVDDKNPIFWRGRDLVWPRAASENEVRIDRQKKLEHNPFAR